MAYINIDNNVINNFKSDNITAMLNSIIDNELAKDVSQVNTDLVNECVDALMEIEKDESDRMLGLVPLMSADDFLNIIKPKDKGFKRLNTFSRVAVIAAVVATSTITVNAAVEGITGVNIIETLGNNVHSKLEDWGLIKTAGIDQFDAVDDEDEITTTTSVSQPSTVVETTTETQISTTTIENTTNHTTEQISSDKINNDSESTTLGETTTQSTTNKLNKTTNAEPVTKNINDSDTVTLLSLRAEFNDFKTDYIYGEKITYDGLKLTAVYSDGSEKSVSLDDCDCTYGVNMNVTADYTLRIIYQSCVVKVNVTVRPDEDTRGSKICSNDEFEYLLTDKGAYITAYKGDDTSINIDEINDNPVIAIGPNVFSNTDIKYVVAQNVIKILPNAFENCNSLIDCYTPNAVYIGDEAFKNCSSLTDAVYNEQLNYIGVGAYSHTAIEELVIPYNITEIPDEFCDECENLKTVIFDGKVTKIGFKAFNNCTSLSSVISTSNLIEVGDYAFYDCKNCVFDSSPSKLEKVGDYAFAYCNNIDFGSLSKNIKSIGKYSFLYCYKLNNVTIPSNITIIPEGAFRGAHISNLILSNGVKVIDDYAFMSTEFSTVTIPNSVEKIGTYSLYSIKLKTAYFNSNLESIGSNAVFKNKNLTFYVYNNSVAYNYAIDNKINYEILYNDKDNQGIDNLEVEDD
jgi:hypothetical protein